MNLQLSVSTCIAAAFVALASTPAGAAGLPDQELAVRATLDERAPLALSGDGAWRLHVDSHDVLHRVRIADPADESSVQLPPGVQALSASVDGRKVALSTNPRCVGLVDFGSRAGDAAKVTWLSTAQSHGWVPQQPVGCDAEWPAATIALSSDGSLVATPDAVFDTTTAELVASLPAGSGGTLRLAFVDRDTRLLVARAVPGQRRDGPSAAGGLSISVWDLASKALVNDIEMPGGAPSAVASLSLDVSPQTGALFHVQESRRDRSPADGAPLELVQLAPDACGVAPRMRAPIVDPAGGAFVVDPWGRWFASSHPLDPARDAAELAAGLRSELVVRDIVTGEPVARITSAYALHGLVATPDGGTLFALAAQPVDAQLGTAREEWPAVPDAGQLVAVALPEAAVGAARNAIQPASTGVCKEPGELPGARAMVRSDRRLVPLWSRDLTADRAVANAAPATSSTHARVVVPDLDKCGDGLEPATFTTPDGGVALDLGAQVARLDPRTGAIVQWLPTPRGKNTCSVVTPSGNGFFNASGDTLTWRPLGAAGDPGRRRVVDRRPGWRAEPTPAQDGTERVLWSATPAAVVPTAAGGDPQDLVVADYDTNGKRLRESAMNSQSYDDGGGDEAGHSSRLPAPCHDMLGAPLAIGYDWRGGPLGTQRGLTCGPLPGAGRLVWWGGATIAPRTQDTSSRSRPQPAIDGAIAVVADDTQWHVVNLALQREIAQIALGQADTGHRDQAWVLAGRRLVLVETTTSDAHRWLRAYPLP